MHSKHNTMKRVIKRTFEVPATKATDFAQAIAKVLVQLPKSAPDTVVRQESPTKVSFDVRYISPMLWNRTIVHLDRMEAKEVRRVNLIDEKKIEIEDL